MTLNTASILAESSRFSPDSVAVIVGDVRLTYSELWLQAKKYAAVLASHGIVPGDHVALMIPNIHEFPIAYYAVLALGAVVVPIHSLLKPEEIEYLLGHSKAACIITSPHHYEQVLPALSHRSTPLFTVASQIAPLPEGAIALDALSSSSIPLEHVSPTGELDPAVILYTSGTTGRPKGAVLSHSNMTWQATVCSSVFGVTSDDIFLGCLPLFHAFGQSNAMNTAFRAGATIVLLPRFDPNQVLDLLEREHITVFLGVPTMYVALLEAQIHQGGNYPDLRMAISGGAALPAAVFEAFATNFGSDIYEGYGLSETSPAATFNQPHFGRKPGTIGTPLWGCEVAVANAEREGIIEHVPQGEVGEIVIRGHGVMLGYLDDPAATAAVMVDGWFRSGDLGSEDEDGFFTIVDRKKDMIIRGGYNVYPREVEEVLHRHPGVQQAAVFGIPNAHYGEEVAAVVVPNSFPQDEASRTALGNELIVYAKEHLAAYKYPRSIWIAQGLPLGPSGKILKRTLREQYAASASLIHEKGTADS